MISFIASSLPWVILAEDAPDAEAAEAAKPFLLQMMENPLFPVVGVTLIFYFIYIVPERRRKVEEAKRMTGLKKNDRVVTAGGLHGTVVNTSEDDVVTVRLDENGSLRVKVSRWAVTVKKPDGEKDTKQTSSEKED
ncbi:MAG: preprotein translocase subunit YajC [Planctomycetota bacterium]